MQTMQIPEQFVMMVWAIQTGLIAWNLQETIKLKTTVAVVTNTQELMKSHIKLKSFCLALLGTLAFVLCSGFESCKTLVKVPTETVRTNLVYITNVIAGEPVVVTKTEVRVETNFVYTPNPAVTEPLKTVGELSPLIPAPFGQIVSLLTGVATVGLGIYAKRKNGQLAESQEMLGAVIDGIEKSAEATNVKNAVSREAAMAGISSKLHKAVKARTG